MGFWVLDYVYLDYVQLVVLYCNEKLITDPYLEVDYSPG